jgi:phage terminase large subunit
MSDPKNYIEPHQIRQDQYKVFCGVDIGFQHPFALAPRAISNDGINDYQIGEYSRSFLDPNERVQVAIRFKKMYNISVFYIDSAHPDDIALFNKAGLNAVGVKKGPGSISHGIGLHTEIIRDGTYKIFRGKCPQTEEEYETYSYPESKNDDIDENPVDMNNHLMDANRYVTMMTTHLRAVSHQAAATQRTRKERVLAGETAPANTHNDNWYQEPVLVGDYGEGDWYND